MTPFKAGGLRRKLFLEMTRGRLCEVGNKNSIRPEAESNQMQCTWGSANGRQRGGRELPCLERVPKQKKNGNAPECGETSASCRLAVTALFIRRNDQSSEADSHTSRRRCETWTAGRKFRRRDQEPK